MVKIDLNCDLGESFGRYTLGEDEAVMQVITSVNIACGLHAGDPLVMDQTVRLAVRYGVSLGAHPGYPDLQGFGRRVMDLTSEEVEAFILYQVAALAGFARGAGKSLVHVKPHGALYNQAARDPRLAEAVARGVARFSRDLILVGLAGSVLLSAGQSVGLHVAAEGFPDRATNKDGSLRARREPGAVLDTLDAICACRYVVHPWRSSRRGAARRGRALSVDRARGSFNGFARCHCIKMPCWLVWAAGGSISSADQAAGKRPWLAGSRRACNCRAANWTRLGMKAARVHSERWKCGWQMCAGLRFSRPG
jgi:UPF0271 protein